MRVPRHAGIKLNLMNFELRTNPVKCLAQGICPRQLSVDEVRVTSLKNAIHPTTKTKLRSFLGLCTVYHRFVPIYTALSTPLNALLEKGQTVQLQPFGNADASAFTAFINTVMSRRILALPSVSLQFEVDADASDERLGFVMLQVPEDGERSPIGDCSRTLKMDERNYSVSEKECLFVV